MSVDSEDGLDSRQKDLDRLIARQLLVLGFPRSELVHRWGYANTAKGLRRLEQLCSGYFTPTTMGMEALAKALEVPVDELERASAMTQRLITEAQHAAEELEWRDWCAVFQPHAILRTERTIPSPIFLVALVGADRILRIDFDFAQPQETWVRQVVARLPKEVIAFGQVTGFFLNISPALCLEFDREGRPVREFARARRPGRAWMEHKGRDITPALRTILGAGKSEPSISSH